MIEKKDLGRGPMYLLEAGHQMLTKKARDETLLRAIVTTVRGNYRPAVPTNQIKKQNSEVQ